MLKLEAIFCPMCDLYSITKGQKAIRDLAKAMVDKAGNMPSTLTAESERARPLSRRVRLAAKGPDRHHTGRCFGLWKLQGGQFLGFRQTEVRTRQPATLPTTPLRI
jgi:hypothetical protein